MCAFVRPDRSVAWLIVIIGSFSFSFSKLKACFRVPLSFQGCRAGGNLVFVKKDTLFRIMFFSSSNAGGDAVAEKRRKQLERRKELDEQVAMSKRNNSGDKENCSKSLYGRDAQGNTPQTPASPTSKDAGAWTGLLLPGIRGNRRAVGLGGYRARGNFMGALSTMMSGETREEAEEKEKSGESS